MSGRTKESKSKSTASLGRTSELNYEYSNEDSSSEISGGKVEVDSTLLLQSTKEEVESNSSSILPYPSIEGTQEEKLAFLKQFITLKGPGGVSFAMACKMVNQARKNFDKFNAMDPNELGEQAQRILTKAKETLEDAELVSYVKRQRVAREKLGIPKLDPTARREAFGKRGRSGELAQTSTTDPTKKLRDATTPKATGSKESSNVQSIGSKPSNGSAGDKVVGKGKQKIDKESVKTTTSLPPNPFRLALVDDGEDRGTVTREITNSVELFAIKKLGKESKGGDTLAFDASWEKGHRIYDCENERSQNFLCSCLEEMKLSNPNIRLLPYEERKHAGHPRGWLWVPLPHLDSRTLLEVLDVQNEDLKVTQNVSVIRAGKPKDYGQHFLLKLNRVIIPALKEKGWRVRAGFFNSTIELEGNVKLNAYTQEPMETEHNDNQNAAD